MKKLLFLLCAISIVLATNPHEDNHALLMRATQYRHAGLTEQESYKQYCASVDKDVQVKEDHFIMAYRISQAYGLLLPDYTPSATRKLFNYFE